MKKRTIWIVGVLVLCVVVALVLILTRPTEEDRVLDFYWETIDMFNNDLETCLATRMPHADPRYLDPIRQSAEYAHEHNEPAVSITNVESVEKIADDVWLLKAYSPRYCTLISHFVAKIDGEYKVFFNVMDMDDMTQAKFDYLEYTVPNAIPIDDILLD